MAKHDVTFDIPQRRLGKTDIDFFVKVDGELFGQLAVSNGSIVWFPRGSKKGRKMGWQRFDEMMQDNSRRRERRK